MSTYYWTYPNRMQPFDSAAEGILLARAVSHSRAFRPQIKQIRLIFGQQTCKFIFALTLRRHLEIAQLSPDMHDPADKGRCGQADIDGKADP